MAQNFVLIGFMGTGKTTVGKELAARLNWPFFDLDVEIEALAQTSITKLFAAGEAVFREYEQTLLPKYLTHEKIVLATGGGAVVRKENRTVLMQARAQGSIIVWLRATAAEIGSRIPQDANRPLFDKETMADLMKSRHHLYSQVACVEVNTDNLPVDSVVQQILDRCGVLDDG